MSYEDPRDEALRKLEIHLLRSRSLLRAQLTDLSGRIAGLLTSNDFNVDERYQAVLFSCATLQYHCRLLQQEHRQLMDWLTEGLRLPVESSELFQATDNVERLLEMVLHSADRFFIAIYRQPFDIADLPPRRAPLITLRDAFLELANGLTL